MHSVITCLPILITSLKDLQLIRANEVRAGYVCACVRAITDYIKSLLHCDLVSQREGVGAE